MPYIGVRRQFFVVVVILPNLKHTFSILITFNANRALKTLHLGPLIYTKGGPGRQMLLIIISKGFVSFTVHWKTGQVVPSLYLIPIYTCISRKGSKSGHSGQHTRMCQCYTGQYGFCWQVYYCSRSHGVYAIGKWIYFNSLHRSEPVITPQRQI